MKSTAIYPLLAAAAGLTMLATPSCAPVFSELQSARTVGDGRFEVTPSYSTVSYTDDGESEQVQEHLGMQAAYGLSAKTDLRVRYERLWYDEISNGVSVFGIGPKFGLIDKKVSFFLPIGNAFGDDYNDNWQIHPTFLWTLPLAKDMVELTIAPKYLITFCEDCNDGTAINFGLSIGELNTWALRIEYGLLYNAMEFGEGHNKHLSFGFSYAFGTAKESK